jgi:hypothetical protein
MQVLCRIVSTGDCPLQLLDVGGCGLLGRCAAALQAMLEGARWAWPLADPAPRLARAGSSSPATGLPACRAPPRQPAPRLPLPRSPRRPAVARRLRVLRLGWNSLGLHAARALAQGLRQASGLEQLHLAWSGVTDTGAAHVAKARPRPPLGDPVKVHFGNNSS